MSHDPRRTTPAATIRTLIRCAVLCCLCALGAAAQSLQIYSEFQRIGPDGQVVKPDAGGESVEVLSPSMARNAWTVYHVAVTMPRGTLYRLYVGQNPDDTFRTRFYREVYAETDAGWIPDSLEEVELPYSSVLPEPNLPSQVTQSFLLEVFAPAKLTPKRYRLEVQMNIEGRWIIYPMEIRVEERTAPDSPAPAPIALPGVAAPVDDIALGPVSAFLCDLPRLPGAVPPTAAANVRSVLRRVIDQDMAIARIKEKEYPPGDLKVRLATRAGIDDLKSWCRKPARPSEATAEWYLKMRNYLYRGLRPI